MVLLPQGLKALKQVATPVGVDLRDADLNLDGGFDSTHNSDVHVQCWHDPQQQRESPQSQDHQARTQTLLQ